MLGGLLISFLLSSMGATPLTPIPFNRDIRPILSNHCFKCHGSDWKKGGLSLLTRESATKKLASGSPAIVPFASDSSQILKRVSSRDESERMPPTGDPLTPSQIAKLKTWIDQGAQYEMHWAYQKPSWAPIQAIFQAMPSPRHPVDKLIQSRLNQEGLQPAPEADRAILIRRLSLDLIGLPPSPEEVDAFVNDGSSNAYEIVVDRLLASPHYGEHQARFWLDLARYADTNGYEKDGRRSIWPYRDWVIQAFNRDMPFDRFTIEQLAGDLLPNATIEQKIATGFHRNTMVNAEGGIDDEEFRIAAVVDRVNTTMEVWMGITMACAQCHNHKFDPFSQKEYYGLFAFFNSTNDHGNSTAPEIPAMSPLLAHQLETNRAEVARLEKGQSSIGLVLGLPGAFGLNKIQRDLVGIATTLKPATTLVMQELPRPRTTRILLRGNHKTPGDEVKPSVPEIFPPPATGAGPPNRLLFARWLVSPENPLVGRVLMNRIWARYFGRGLVDTLEDFGYQGELPSHPELLDFLALELVKKNWSLKAMHRLLVTSATYRQSSIGSRELLERDPYNRLLARGSRIRLDAEQIRDNALAISGLLDRKLGGPSVFPFQPEGIWTNPYSGDKWTMSSGGDQYRRGIYTFWRRTAPYAAFMAFDAPSREVACERRSRTNTPLQALATLNDRVFLEASIALTQRVLQHDADDTDRIEYAFRLCVARKPLPAEAALLGKLLVDNRERYQKDLAAARALTKSIPRTNPNSDRPAEMAAWIILVNLLLNLDETVMRG